MTTTTQSIEFERREELVVLGARVYKRQIRTLQDIAKEEGIPIAFVLRGIIDKVAKTYLHKRGEFYCQVCGGIQKNKDEHEIIVLDVTLSVGDCCYFNDAYRAKAKAMI